MKTLSNKNISKIGIGSYGIGGRGHRDLKLTEKLDDENYIAALVYSLEKGMNFTEIALGYGHGNSLALFKQALERSSIDREDIFFTHSLYTRDLPSLEVIKEDIADFHKVMATDYADSTLITQSLIMKFGEETIYPLLHSLFDDGKTRYVSLSNANPKGIRAFKKEFNDKFIAHEGHLSFEIRALQDKGVFKTCDELNVRNIIWRPLRRNQTAKQNWELLDELAKKYNKTHNQIVLNWICSLRYNPMVMSANKKHIDENIASTEFHMSDDDYQRMTDFRPKNYHPPKIDWESPGVGSSIVTLISDFENHVSQ
ncbi:aldo/keto reductase [Patescibacteria group bacterium]|nr:aldo/keto reductase [Patescibacteria group bacterium]MBU1868210.1 aldo/keto reductase [Patescibacteria group bacterium]